MRTVSVVHVTAAVIIGLFFIQLTRRLTENRSNSVVQGINGGLNWLVNGSA